MLATPRLELIALSLSFCLVTPDQSLAGPKLLKKKKRHKIYPVSCASHTKRDCSGLGIGEAVLGAVCWQGWR
jgi:hypothetical protein